MGWQSSMSRKYFIENFVKPLDFRRSPKGDTQKISFKAPFRGLGVNKKCSNQTH